MIYLSQIGIKTYNYYWNRTEQTGVSYEELATVGVIKDDILVKEICAKAIMTANEKLKNLGYCLIIKEGYRSPEMYQLIYDKRVVKFGKTQTDQLLNMKNMPHSTGLVIDAVLWDLKNNCTVEMYKHEHGADAFFYSFYKDNPKKDTGDYLKKQTLLIDTMLNSGFTLGSKGEFFHFELNDSEPIT
ncbi:hypothetical protein COB57_02655 [Candidatus Peregrinibacteria bacterium]|nr:MAG: hypothetical protein COB57_02655 [Candidatus Peregrinibacteria bacterium]